MFREPKSELVFMMSTFLVYIHNKWQYNYKHQYNKATQYSQSPKDEGACNTQYKINMAA